MSDIFSRNAQKWFPVYNADEEAAPPYSLLAVTGVDDQGNYTVTRPTLSSQKGLLINGPGTIPAGQYGQAHATFPAIIAYDDGSDTFDPNDDGSDDSDAPQPGQLWGSVAADQTAANAWKLQPGQSGFLILGGAGYGLVNAAVVAQAHGSVRVTSTTAQKITLFDGTEINAYPGVLAQGFSGALTDVELTSGSDQLVSPTQANFSSASDVGATVTGDGIQTGTTITGVTDAHTATMSKTATFTLNPASVVVSTQTGIHWNEGPTPQDVWFVDINNTAPTAEQHYKCRLIGQDANGVEIWLGAVSSQTLPLAWVRVGSSPPQTIFLGGRQITDAVLTAGGTTLTSPTQGNFTAGDANKFISGTGIPVQRQVTDANFQAGSNQVGSSQANFRTGTWPVGDEGAQFECGAAGVSTTIQSVSAPNVAILNQAAAQTLYDQTAVIGTNTIISSVTPAVPPSTLSSLTMSQAATQTLSGGSVQVATVCTISGWAAVIDGWVDLFCEFTTGDTVWFYEVNGRVPNAGEVYQCRLLDTDAAGTQIWATRFHGCGTYQIGPFTTHSNCGTQSFSNYIVVPNGEICQAFVATTPDPAPSPPTTVCDGTVVTGVSCGNGVANITTSQICTVVDSCGDVSSVSLQNSSSYQTGGQSVLCPPPSTSMVPLTTDIFFFGNYWDD